MILTPFELIFLQCTIGQQVGVHKPFGLQHRENYVIVDPDEFPCMYFESDLLSVRGSYISPSPGHKRCLSTSFSAVEALSLL